MDTRTTYLPRAGTGIAGLDDVLGGGFAPQPAAPARGQPGHRQDHDRAAVPDGRCGRQARAASTSAWPRPSRSCAPARARTAGRSTTRSRSSSWCRRKACSIPSSSRACSIRPTSSWARRPSASSRRSSGSKPKRVVIDSLSEIRLLAQSSLRYRRQILALKHYFARHQSTVLMLDDLTTETTDRAVHSIAHGVDPSRAARADLWRRAAAAARRQVPRPAVPRRLSRLHASRRAACRCFRAWSRPSIAPDLQRQGAQQRRRRARRAARRRRRRRVEHADARSGRHRQVAAHRCSTSRPRSRAASAPRCSCSTRSSGCCSSRAQGARHRPRRRCATPASCSSSRWTPPSCRRASSPTGCAHCVDRESMRIVAIDSLNGYQAAMPEEQFLILHLHELLQYLNRQRRRDLPHRRAARHGRRHEADRSTSPISPTP